ITGSISVLRKWIPFSKAQSAWPETNTRNAPDRYGRDLRRLKHQSIVLLRQRSITRKAPASDSRHRLMLVSSHRLSINMLDRSKAKRPFQTQFETAFLLN